MIKQKVAIGEKVTHSCSIYGYMQTIGVAIANSTNLEKQWSYFVLSHTQNFHQ